jgi:hypothetical protein
MKACRGFLIGHPDVEECRDSICARGLRPQIHTPSGKQSTPEPLATGRHEPNPVRAGASLCGRLQQHGKKTGPASLLPSLLSCARMGQIRVAYTDGRAGCSGRDETDGQRCSSPEL